MGDDVIKRKALIIGSSQYKGKFYTLKDKLELGGYEVKMTAFDFHPELDDLGVCQYNKDLILWSDIVFIIWDARSSGTIFDMGMVFMANKPLVISYIESKTFAGVFSKYAEGWQGIA